MVVSLGTQRSGLALPAAARTALRARCERAIRRARRSGDEVLAGVSLRLTPDADPSAVAFASRHPGEPWFCLEQPDRDGAALATLGAVVRLRAAGPRRFIELAAAWRRLAGSAQAEAPDGPPGAGLVAVGGFAFAPDGGAAPHWTGFAPGELTVPEVAIARRGADVRLTVAVLASADDLADELVARAERRLAGLRGTPLPLLDPAPAGRFHVASTAPPEHYEEAVARAVERIRAGAFEKIVLAREVAVHAPAPHDAAAVFGVLRAGFDSCYVYCAGTGDGVASGAVTHTLWGRSARAMRRATIACSSRSLSERSSCSPRCASTAGSALRRVDPASATVLARRPARRTRSSGLAAMNAASPVPAAKT